MRIKHIEATNVEVDDVISGYSFKYGDKEEVVIASFDSDFFQLISENVRVLRYRGKHTVICNKKYIHDRYFISPCQYADFKSLTGDKCDNIKGLDKVGIKTASALINQFGSLQKIIDKAGEISNPRIRESTLRNTGRLLNNYRLIKLDDRAGLPFGLNELSYTYSGIATYEVLKGIGLR